MIALIVVFCLLLASVIVLAAMRKAVGSQEEDLLLHAGDPTLVEKKSFVVERIDAIEKWGKTMTVITVVYGLILLGWLLWTGWHQSAQIVQ